VRGSALRVGWMSRQQGVEREAMDCFGLGRESRRGGPELKGGDELRPRGAEGVGRGSRHGRRQPKDDGVGSCAREAGENREGGEQGH
jgi:hypothetical protein